MPSEDKIRPHHKVAAILRQKDVVSPDEIRNKLASDDAIAPVLYRLSTFIYDVKKDGGRIRVHKKGRNVVGYELMNRDQFDDSGHLTGRAFTQNGKPRKKGFTKPVGKSPIVYVDAA